MNLDSRRARWAIPFAFWSIPALFLATLSMRQGDQRTVGSFLAEALPWYYWAAVTPLILRIARHYPFESLREKRGLLTHTAAALAFGFGEGIFTVVLALAFGIEAPDGGDRRSLLIGAIVLWTMFGLLFYSMIASVGFALGYQEQLREREVAATQLEARLVEAQLGALRMQLQPHFLFNTLNTIAMHVREGDSATSTRLLARLSEMLRHLLDDGGAQEVPLAVELGHARRYLDIEQARFSDRLTVRYDVSPELDDALVPSLVLQPLIENAIRHGIASRARAGVIGIAARRIENDVQISISNEGAHLPDDFTLLNRKGIGLKNTSLRLQHLYQNQGRLTLRNTDDGVVAEVIVPYHTAPVTAWANV